MGLCLPAGPCAESGTPTHELALWNLNPRASACQVQLIAKADIPGASHPSHVALDTSNGLELMTTGPSKMHFWRLESSAEGPRLTPAQPQLHAHMDFKQRVRHQARSAAWSLIVRVRLSGLSCTGIWPPLPAHVAGR